MTYNSCPELIAPFALLGNEQNAHEIRSFVSAACKIDESLVQDVYPCTPGQESAVTMQLQAKDGGIRAIMELHPDVSAKSFCQAWERVIEDLGILRMRIVHHKDTIETCLGGLGQPSSQYALLHQAGQPRMFIWTLHRAMFDYQVIKLALDRFHQVFAGQPLPMTQSFQTFTRLTQSQDQHAAQDYWASHLGGYHGIMPLEAIYGVKLVTELITCMQTVPLDSTTNAIDPEMLVYASFAILKSSITESTDIIFGGIGARDDVVTSLAEPTATIVPIRIAVDPHMKMSEFLDKITSQRREQMLLKQMGLSQIMDINETTRKACSFDTLVLVGADKTTWESSPAIGRWIKTPFYGVNEGYTMIFQAFFRDDHVDLEVCFNEGRMESSEVKEILQRLSGIMQQLAQAASDQTICEIQKLSQQNPDDIWTWNEAVPATVERCVHDLVQEQAAARPDAAAVCASDGDFTYSELDDVSSRLALDLLKIGVGPEILVPLCFEKSRWTVVAMLAVFKAGGGLIPLDPSQGADRRERVIAQADARIVLTSTGNAEMLTRPGRVVVTVGPDSVKEARTEARDDCTTNVGPTSTAYVLFTSGSTGQPKGVVIEHQALASSCVYNSRQIGLDQTCRVLQFTSYEFDVSMMEIFATLVRGGCVCVPSDSDRMNDVGQVANVMSVNTAFFTPSVARMLDPSQFSTLTTMIMGGEKSTQDDIAKWSHLSKVVDGYGPTETTIFCSLNVMDDGKKNDKGIGHAVGCVLWVVAADDHGRLVPIGSVGELLVEGPILSRGYLKDAERTAAAFIEDPPWLVRGAPGRPGRRGRLYKTGDLVRYNEDGSLAFVGRKDSQVKIRGQRVELGEVEHHVLACVKGARQVAAEVITPAGDGASAMLAAFVVSGESERSDEKEVLAKVTKISAAEEDALAERLPVYMMPAIYFSVTKIPINTAGKTDRRRLRETGAGFSAQQLAELRSVPLAVKRAPSTQAELALQKIWATVLNIDADVIGADDSFFRLGGDSIAAMKLVAQARQDGLTISVADVFRDPRLASLSQAASHVRHAPVQKLGAFSLIRRSG